MKNILVTGRNGFVGRALVNQLKKRHKVVSLVRGLKDGIDYSNEEIIAVNDRQAVRAVDLQKYDITLIIHLAAAIKGRPDYLLENNVNFSEAIFNMAQRFNVPVIYLSSTNVLFTEHLGAYACSKKICEELLIKSEINYLIIRVPLIIGKDSPSLNLVKDFYQKFYFFPLFGQQKGKVQPIHISSLVDKILTKIDEYTYGRKILNLVGNSNYTYQEVIAHLLSQTRKPYFVKVPFIFSKYVVKALEKMNISFFISWEELKSINMDKIVKEGIPDSVEYVNNDKQILFA